MRSVIAEYDAFDKAQQAVHTLEAHLSIQDIVIADRAHRLGRKLHPKRSGSVGSGSGGNFLVVMSGPCSSIEQARELLLHRESSRED